jgi:hypothetical protein
MAKGNDSGRNESRIVDMRRWTMRNHPSTGKGWDTSANPVGDPLLPKSGGSGKKPPKAPKTKTGGDPAGFDKSMGYMADKMFPSSPKDPIEKRPDYHDNVGRVSDMNPKNNPYLYKDKDK